MSEPDVPQKIEQLPALPPRASDSHKGDYGRVLIVAGSRGMSGAACLAGVAALRGGAGLVRVATPQGVCSAVAAYEPSYLTCPLPEDHDGRLAAAARVEVYRRTAHLRCAALPGRLTAELVGEIANIYPNVMPARNVMETGLANINAIMHPAGMVSNAGWIEKTSGDFYFYREALSPAVANVIAAVDRERLRIVDRLGLPGLSFIEIFFQAGLTSQAARASGSVFQATQESAPNRTIKSPAKLDHRYLNEDVGFGLVPMSEIGRLCGVQTPVIDSLITLASEMNQKAYRQEGLTLEKMGLVGLNLQQFDELLRDGN